MDYRHLHAVIQSDAFPIPRKQDYLDAMAGATLFSIMDITSTYTLVPVAEEDITIMVFVTRHCLSEFTTMTFGLITASETYERLMKLALEGLQWSLCFIYVDDIIDFVFDFHGHVDNLDKVLTWIGTAGLMLQLVNMYYMQQNYPFWHILSLKK